MLSILEEYGFTQRFEAESAGDPQWKAARIIAQHRELYKLITEDGERMAGISGKLRYETEELAQYPAVGDFVMTEYDSADAESHGVIHKILPRKSVFLRKAVGVEGQAQVVAANIDYVFVCMSLNRNFNLSRLERYLSVGWDSGAVPVVVLTKSDLCECLPERVAQAERASGYCDVIAVSVLEEAVASHFEKYLGKGRTAAFIGSSGVGKSTLINALLGTSALVTSEIGKGDKGRHTTTGRELFLTGFGGAVIDTPGMRELGAESADLSKSFEDIEALAGKCKFRDCTHTKEPGCAVWKAVEEGLLEERRLASYQKLKIESGYGGMNSREIEQEKLSRMFRQVGGMKNARQISKYNPKNR